MCLNTIGTIGTIGTRAWSVLQSLKMSKGSTRLCRYCLHLSASYTVMGCGCVKAEGAMLHEHPSWYSTHQHAMGARSRYEQTPQLLAFNHYEVLFELFWSLIWVETWAFNCSGSRQWPEASTTAAEGGGQNHTRHHEALLLCPVSVPDKLLLKSLDHRQITVFGCFFLYLVLVCCIFLYIFATLCLIFSTPWRIPGAERSKSPVFSWPQGQGSAWLADRWQWTFPWRRVLWNLWIHGPKNQRNT